MKRFLISAHAVFAFVGIATTIIGPLLPLLAHRWLLSDRQSGLLFVVQFVSGFTGAILSTRLARTFSLHIIARGGMLFTALGFFGLSTPSFALGIAGIAVYGFGIGLATPSISAAVAEAVPEKSAALLNLLNFAWAVGAITAPNLVLWALRHSAFQVRGMLAGFAVVLCGTAFLIPRIAVTSLPEETSTAKLPRNTLGLIIACGILIFIYVGIENGVGGWLPTFATRVHNFSIESRALLQDTFWVTFLLARFVAPAFLEYISERLLLTLSIGVAAVGTVAMILVSVPWALFVSVGIVGIGCAAIFPTAIAILLHRLHGQSGSKLGFMYAAAGLGGAALPFCIGTLSAATQNLRIGMSLLVLAELLLLAAHFFMSQVAARPDESEIASQKIAAARA
ncbi:MAG TPA: MFS transporter [Candidatus Koribacter sp.]|jgi:fucose permease